MNEQRNNYMTPACAQRLREELKRLLYAERPEMVETVAWAASNGDRSENADYHYGKKRLREIDRRIRYLTGQLDRAMIVDPVDQGKISDGRILFGATVTVENAVGEQRCLSLVGGDEMDAARGYISWFSPVGKALLGARDGDEVTVITPGGREELEIIRVEYRSLD